MNTVGMVECPLPHSFASLLCDLCELVTPFLDLSDRRIRRKGERPTTLVLNHQRLPYQLLAGKRPNPSKAQIAANHRNNYLVGLRVDCRALNDRCFLSQD